MHRSPFSFLPFGLLLAMGAAIPASAQSDYSMDWFVIAGGGGESSAPDPVEGDLQLTGTIGQPATDNSTGSDYSLFTGYWAISGELPIVIFLDGFESTAQ